MARSASNSNLVRIFFDGFELAEANAILLRDGRVVAVALTPFALLGAVWGHRFFSD